VHCILHGSFYGLLVTFRSLCLRGLNVSLGLWNRLGLESVSDMANQTSVGNLRKSVCLCIEQFVCFFHGADVSSILVELLASLAPRRLEPSGISPLDNAGIARRRVLFAAGAASFPSLCLPLLAKATLFLDRKCSRAGVVELAHEWIARRMRSATHLLS
jgi:hypothetical protein